MDTIKIFISYSSQNKHIAGLLKQQLQIYFGFEVFLAHDDLSLSIEWEDEIPKRIKCSDIFIPLLTEACKNSDFVDQEIGMAHILKKKIIPIKADRTNPYGFIRKFQALSLHSFSTEESMKLEILNIASVIYFLIIEDIRYIKLRTKAIDSIISVFQRSPSFYITGVIIRSLLKIPSFTEKQLMEIVNAIKTNNQINKELYALPKLKDFLKNTYNINI